MGGAAMSRPKQYEVTLHVYEMARPAVQTLLSIAGGKAC